MQVLVPDDEACTTYTIRGFRPMDDDEYYEFCMKNPDLRIEREADGEIIIMPPTGGETSCRNSDLTAQLTVWSKRDGRGRAFDSNAEFFLPDGAALSPDASSILKDRLSKLTGEQKRRFIPDRKSTRLNSSHLVTSSAVFCLKKKPTRSTTGRAEIRLSMEVQPLGSTTHM